jgi:hypothetical protein
MKRPLLTAGIAAAALGGALAAQAATPTGEYVEARSASVFAGACHYSGQYVSGGRDAISAWHFTGGDWHGVSLAGLSAVAVIRADDNLGIPTSQRSTMLFVDAQASPAQQKALDEALATRYAAVLGTVTDAGAVPIAFARTPKGGFRVSAPQVATLDIDALPNRECCTEPNLVWYTPLAAVTDRRVGYTQTASCTARTGGDPWTRGNENSAFYGTFTF